MSDSSYQLLTLATLVLSSIGSIAAAIIGWINREKIHEVHLTMNSRLDELVQATKVAGIAQGAEEVRAENRAQRAKALAISPTLASHEGWSWIGKHGHDEPKE